MVNNQREIILSGNQLSCKVIEWWNIVKQFLSKKGISPDDIPPLEDNGTTYYSNKDKANVFNDYFVSQGSVNDDGRNPPTLPQSLGPTLDDIVLSTNEVESVLESLDTTKAVGPDLIHNKILKAASGIIAKPLTDLFNKSLAESHFPDLWKIAHVTPIHKKRF